MNKKGLTTLLCLLWALTLQAKDLQFLFLNPAEKPEPFWSALESFMRAAANDLKVQLKILYGGRNHLEIVKKLQEELKKNPKIDAVIFQAQKKNGVELLKITEAAKVKSFIINAGLTEDQRQQVGGPREKFQHWLGQMLPNDEQAGYDLMNLLIAKAQEKGKQGPQGQTTPRPLSVFALSGEVADGASIRRVNGIMRAMNTRKEAQLLQVVPAQWSLRKASKVTKVLNQRYPQAVVIWSANDTMALGVVEALKELKIKPGQDIFTGGIDWDLKALAAVKDGEMEVSLGGHFMEGGWALVLLYDYFHGRDFASQSTQMESAMTAIHAGNVSQYLPVLESGHWEKIDFATYSKVLNPELKNYPFQWEKVFESLIK